MNEDITRPMTNLEILEMKHGINKATSEQPKSECKCIDCNLPELETLSYKPGVPVLAADSDGKLLGEAGLRALNKHIKQNCKPEPSPYNAINKPEQPNTELLIVKTIQGLMSAASRELTELNKITSIAKHKVLIDQVLEDIDSTENTTLFELQKAFE